ncbi:unnamed protein product [Closterium sp. Naga37s-1]|nr:unnamed protein product [Closterium sp. Naga37s-1]
MLSLLLAPPLPFAARPPFLSHFSCLTTIASPLPRHCLPPRLLVLVFFPLFSV